MAENNEEVNNKEAKIYEVGYLLVPELAESAVAEAVNEIKNVILDKQGGAEISSEMPKPIDLAYPMEKHIGGKIERYVKAHFGWIKFELPQDKITEVEAALKKDNKIIRFLIIKTVRENTMLVRKSFTRPAETASVKKSGAAGEAVPAMTEEELDKTIEELVIE